MMSAATKPKPKAVIANPEEPAVIYETERPAMTYKWRTGSQFSKVPAEDAYRFVETVKAGLPEEKRDLLPRAIWKAAEPATHPMHQAFPEQMWNDAEAADLYRDNLARSFVGSIVEVRIAKECPEEQPRRAFINVGADESRPRCYMKPVEVLTNAEAKAAAYKDCRRQLLSIRRYYLPVLANTSLRAAFDAIAAIPERD